MRICMQLVFIDETKIQDIFCISMVIINSAKYALLKREYLSVFENYGWEHNLDNNEFKGNVIFSSTRPKASKNILIETRVEICNEFLKHVIGERNKRMDVIFFANELKGKDRWKVYFDVVPKLLEKKLKKQPKKDGKNCVAIFCDDFGEKKNYKKDFLEMRSQIATILKNKELIFFEEIFFCPSTSYTMGITYADIIGFLTAKNDFGNEKKEEKKEAVEKLLKNIEKIENKFRYKET